MRQKVSNQLSVNDPQSNSGLKVSSESISPSSETISLSAVLPTARFHAGDDIHFTNLCDSTAPVEPGDLAVYRLGHDDPARLVADAMARGAAGILTEQLLPCPLPQCVVGDTDLATASILSHLNDRPDQKLFTIGVVGSAGKTTASLLISTLVRAHGIRTAYQTDLGASDGVVQSTDKHGPLTADGLVHWMAEAVDCESQVAIVELADDAARHGRYDCVGFDMLVVVGTTLSQNDFGPSPLVCVLDRLKPGGVVVASADDASAMRVIGDAGVECATYGVRKSADVTAKVIEQGGGMSTLLVTHQDTTAVLETPLCGGAMASNHAAALMVGLLIDLPLPQIAETLGTLRSIPGRQQRLEQWGHAGVTLDVAGTPDRCATSLRTARAMKGAGRLWCLAAIADEQGDTSLARLGNLLERFADHVVVTAVPGKKSSFLSASHQVLDGVQECAAMRLVADRERAIRWVMGEAKPNDTILVLTNESSQSAHEERTKIAALEKLVQSIRDEQEATGAKPALKVFC